MADELNSLLYQTVKVDSFFQGLTGATAQDPRFYKRKAPIKLVVSDAQPSFAVYYFMGSANVGSPKVEIVQRNDRSYGIEIFGKKEGDVEDLAYRIERIFYDAQLETANYLVGRTYATRGAIDFDDPRQLYVETAMVHFTHIYALNLAS